MDFEQEIEFKDLMDEQKDKKRDEESRFFSALSKVLATQEGRLVFHHIFNLQPIDERTFTSDVVLNAFQQGRRDLVLEIMQIVKNNFNFSMIESILKEKL